MRRSGTFAAVNRRVVAWMLLLLGFTAASLGLAVLGVELWHAVVNRHPAIGFNIGSGVGLFAFGAGLIQTGSVQNSLAVLRDLLGEAIPLLASRKPGGERRTDPPIDDDVADVADLSDRRDGRP